ncbi:pathogenesis-related protein 1 [Thermodesulfovibrio aggregans]|uniref:Pathogenesis-related protein 1 n=1 Tax=Thermodesulfovibrio aggregans TaxID=86166 RepID=A0A0U9HRL7_9BACT|nr:CAP domain-containing protein [Thermodesulfovibrio aggregans]GAQ95460.1 pathogenesis-related protein 1 [Thermodesulfovibrio aggregans]
MRIYVIGFTLLLSLLILINCTGIRQYPAYYRHSAELTLEEKRELLAEHNKWRNQVGVPDLIWSTELEEIAKDWAYKLAKNYGCRMIHSSNKLGENIFWANYAVSAKYVVDYWADERFYYDYASNTCKQGRQCGHYTQLVWSETRQLGCGRALCSSGEEIWVCNYNPAGNVKGKRPY